MTLSASIAVPHPVQDGRVVHRRMIDVPAAAETLRRETCHSYNAMQMVAYDTCLRDYGAHHRWLGTYQDKEVERLPWVLASALVSASAQQIQPCHAPLTPSSFCSLH